MNSLYTIMLSLLSLAGLVVFHSETPRGHFTQAAVVEPAAPAQDSTRVVARASKRKNKKERKPSAAGVTLKREVNRATLSQRSAEGNNVEVVIMSAGVTLRNIEEMQLVGSSGNPVHSNSYIGFDEVSFPFEGNIRFKAANKFGTGVYDREVRFKVNEPGRWTLRLDL